MSPFSGWRGYPVVPAESHTYLLYKWPTSGDVFIKNTNNIKMFHQSVASESVNSTGKSLIFQKPVVADLVKNSPTFLNPYVHYRLHNSRPLDHVRSQL